MKARANSVGLVVIGLFWLAVGPVGSVRGELVWYYGGRFDQAIPADPDATIGWMDDVTIEVSDHLIIADLNVMVSIKHTNVFDLQLFLVSPSGTVVTLNEYDPFTDYFEGADYQQTVFDDEAEICIAEATPPFRGWFRPRPEEALAAFDGQDAYGTWSLRIYDAYALNEGSLEAFGLIVTSTPEPATLVLLLAGAGWIGLSRRRRG